MAYTSDYSYGSSYGTYSNNYYGYQVGVIFAILIAGLILLAVCAAIVYFGCVRVMRRNEKQRRSGSVSTRASGLSVRARQWQPTTASYAQFSSEKPPLPYEPPGNSYSPDQETPILQSSMHTQAAYIPPPPTYAARPASFQQQQSVEKTFSRPQSLEDAHPRQVTIAERPHTSVAATPTSKMYTRQGGSTPSSAAWQETVVTRSTVPEQQQQQQRIVAQTVTFQTSSV